MNKCFRDKWISRSLILRNQFGTENQFAVPNESANAGAWLCQEVTREKSRRRQELELTIIAGLRLIWFCSFSTPLVSIPKKMKRNNLNRFTDFEAPIRSKCEIFNVSICYFPRTVRFALGATPVRTFINGCRRLNLNSFLFTHIIWLCAVVLRCCPNETKTWTKRQQQSNVGLRWVQGLDESRIQDTWDCVMSGRAVERGDSLDGYNRSLANPC